MLSILTKLIVDTPLLGLLLGPIVSLLGDGLHKVWGWLDRQLPWVKQVAAVALSFVLVAVVHFFGISAPVECASAQANGISSACEAALTSGPFLQAIVSALVAIAFKHGQQNAK